MRRAERAGKTEKATVTVGRAASETAGTTAENAAGEIATAMFTIRIIRDIRQIGAMFITRVIRRAMFIILDIRRTGFIRDTAHIAFIRDTERLPFTGREIDIGATGKLNLLSSKNKERTQSSRSFFSCSELRVYA